MDARLRSIIEPDHLLTYGFSVDAPTSADIDDGFPSDLSSTPESRLLVLSDALFLELDSEMPDLRAMERYLAICDELALRQIRSGVA